MRMKQIAELCNGSTADSDSVCWGSNPYSAAKKTGTTLVVPVFLPKGIRTTEPAGENESLFDTTLSCLFFCRKGFELPSPQAIKSLSCRRAQPPQRIVEKTQKRDD